MTEIVDRVSRVVVDHRDVEKMLSVFAQQSREECDLDGRMIALMRELPDRDPDYLLAIEWRLGALAHLHQSHPNLGGFAKKGEAEGELQLSPGAVRAICLCQLVEVDRFTLTFDPKEFDRRALEEWGPEGTA